MTGWHSDLLDGFESRDLPVSEDVPVAGEPVDVDLVATLVRRQDARTRRAVLYLHGWNDYFFQTHLAEHWAAMGYDFHALDLRRYGRSHRRGQLFGYVVDLDDYTQEIDAAIEIIRADHDELLLMGHSTGGLIAALWASDHPGVADGLVLNSPWLDLQGSAMVRALGGPVIDRLGASLGTAILKLPDAGFYARVLHADKDGEWTYDTDLKASPSPPVRVGWLRAILQGHQRVAAGLDIDSPVLVMCSARSDFRRKWSEDFKQADTVLDVEQISARAGRLGSDVTLRRFDGGLHDLVLSAPEVRKRVLAAMEHWTLDYCCQEHHFSP